MFSTPHSVPGRKRQLWALAEARSARHGVKFHLKSSKVLSKHPRAPPDTLNEAPTK